MNSDEQKKLLELYEQKKDCVAAILKITKERKFDAVEEDVERFHNFFQKRGTLFEKCEVIDRQIKRFTVSEKDRKSFFYKDVEKIDTEIKKIVGQIIDIDRQNKKIMDKLMEVIKGNIRNLKVSQQVRKGYGDYFPQGESYGGFDSSK